MKGIDKTSFEVILKRELITAKSFSHRPTVGRAGGGGGGAKCFTMF